MKAEATLERLSGETKSFLSFKLAEEHFTIPVMKIMEILEVPKITKVPQSPNFLVGVINLRGAVLPVIDTRIKFGMSQIQYTINTCILVLSIEVNDEELVVGALVDSVSEVFELDEDKIKPTPTIATKYRADYIQGMIQENDHFMMVLNIDKVFSSNDLESISESKGMPIKED
ncbi:MAG: chemotaxis protein CheW [Fluviicola sp.]|nr:chemotaxis protein CheW [Fluviicola sp.]